LIEILAAYNITASCQLIKSENKTPVLTKKGSEPANNKGIWFGRSCVDIYVEGLCWVYEIMKIILENEFWVLVNAACLSH
jgi:hypothetical protein